MDSSFEWAQCSWCGLREWNADIPYPLLRLLCGNCLPNLAEWKHCHWCLEWAWNPRVGVDLLPYPLYENCLGLVRPPHLVDREWARCYWCGWWEWGPCTLTTICQFCLHKMAVRLKLAFRPLPLSVCAKIGEMLAPKREWGNMPWKDAIEVPKTF